MKRRNFLKSIGLLAGASALPSLPEFKPVVKPVKQEFYHFEKQTSLADFNERIEMMLMAGVIDNNEAKGLLTKIK